MTQIQHRLLAASAAAVAAAGLLVGCSSGTEKDQPSTSTAVSTDVSKAPATTVSPSAPSTPAPVTGEAPPATGSMTTGESPGGPSQTVSNGPSASPPVERSPSAPTGDNLPGENGGPNATPGTPGDDN